MGRAFGIPVAEVDCDVIKDAIGDLGSWLGSFSVAVPGARSANG